MFDISLQAKLFNTRKGQLIKVAWSLLLVRVNKGGVGVNCYNTSDVCQVFPSADRMNFLITYVQVIIILTCITYRPLLTGSYNTHVHMIQYIPSYLLMNLDG